MALSVSMVSDLWREPTLKGGVLQGLELIMPGKKASAPCLGARFDVPNLQPLFQQSGHIGRYIVYDDSFIPEYLCSCVIVSFCSCALV